MSFNIRGTVEPRTNMKAFAGEVVQLISSTPVFSQTVTQVVSTGASISLYTNVPIIGTDTIGKYTDANILMFPNTTIPITSEGYDVFSIIGDVNAVGYGYSGGPVNGIDGLLDTTYPQIKQLGQLSGYNNTIVLATEPLQHAENVSGNTNHIGFGLSFARNYLKTLSPVAVKRKVLLVPSASFGSSFSANNWNPGNTLYNTAVSRINTAMASGRTSSYNRFCAFLVHLGINDAIASCTGSSFSSSLNNMITSMRSSITGASNAPVIIGGLPPAFVASNTGTAVDIQSAINNASSINTKCVVVSATGLSSDTNYGTTAFNAPSQRTLGSLYLDAYTNIISVPPKIYGITFISNSSYTITLSWIQNSESTTYNIYTSIIGLNHFSLSTSVTDVNNVILMSLTPSTSYDIYIVASNMSGNSIPSSIYTFRTGDLALPYQVTGLVTSSVTTSSLTLSWNYTVNAQTYLVFVNGVLYNSTNLLSMNITGITTGLSCTFTVQAVNTLGTGLVSPSVVVNTGIPTQVTGLTAVSILANSTQISLTWNASTSLYPITYQIWSALHGSTLTLNSTVSVTNALITVTTGVLYDFQIISTTQFASGTPSSIISASTSTPPPPVLRLNFSTAPAGSTMTNISITGSEAGTATLSYNTSGSGISLSVVNGGDRNHNVLQRTSVTADSNIGGFINITRALGGGVNQTAYTLSCWIKLYNFTFSNWIWGPTVTNPAFFGEIQAFTTQRFRTANNKSGNVLTDTTALVTNTWYHVVLVYDSTITNKLTFYVNGTATSTLTNPAAITSTTAPIQICAWNNAYGINGAIDYPQFWDVALQARHVAQIYQDESM